MFHVKRLFSYALFMSWINETSETSRNHLQNEPPKRKHQNKARERVIEDHIWIHPFHFSFLLFLVVIIISFEHGKCRK